MKRKLVTVIIMFFIPICYAGAEDKEVVNPAKDIATAFSEISLLARAL